MDRLDYPENKGLIFFRNLELNFLQDGITDALKGVLSSFSDQSLASSGVKLSGCEVTVAGDVYSITAGYIYLKGEVLRVNAHTLDSEGSTVWLDVEQTDYDSSSPAKVDDGSTHQTRQRRVGKLTKGSSVPDDRMAYNAPYLQTAIRNKVYHRAMPMLFNPGIIGNTLDDFFNMNTGLGLNNTEFEGWAVMDGRNNTPDWRGKFVVGYHDGNTDYKPMSKTGGLDKVSLDLTEIPPHTHSSFNTVDGADNQKFGTDSPRHANGVTNTGSSGGENGSVKAHENRPPYVVAAWIVRIA